MPDALRRVAASIVASIFLLLPLAAAAQVPDSLGPAVAVEVAAPGEMGGTGEAVVDPATLPHDLSPIGMFLGADHVVKAVIGGLALASVATWAIFLTKVFELTAVRRRWTAFRHRLGRVGTLDEALELSRRRRDAAARLVRAASDEIDVSRGLPAAGIKERVVIRFDRIQAGSSRELARGTGVLASVGSLSPFVGLFGTVWGIMNSFIGISQSNTTNLAIVAPGIAEALFATGVGLAAAIPAVLFYNIFARMTAANKAALADVAAEALALLSRDLDRAAQRGSLRIVAAAAE
ncbi:biopolymer transport protein ExbB [Kaistia hirudinis]|uniref:Biopolymer transport protein ExbB n=1 Tax=Kaistia hirudinis TaxID=1293440 RepID=A0A840AVP5_9HYPH|nr:tonB-system energizer ExbB [Kaistia hirudinis]MBB3933137.1 biopolymer transport protein ExbB [Kaistia hirudinis]